MINFNFSILFVSYQYSPEFPPNLIVLKRYQKTSLCITQILLYFVHSWTWIKIISLKMQYLIF